MPGADRRRAADPEERLAVSALARRRRRARAAIWEVRPATLQDRQAGAWCCTAGRSLGKLDRARRGIYRPGGLPDLVQSQTEPQTPRPAALRLRSDARASTFRRTDCPPDRRLRAHPAHLGIDRWLVCGGSWGTTLGLAYAQTHPESRDARLILLSVVGTSRGEVEWITRAMGRIFPEEWTRFRDAVPEAARDGDLSAAYSRLLHDADLGDVASAPRVHGARGRRPRRHPPGSPARSALRRRALPPVLRADRDALLEPRRVPGRRQLLRTFTARGHPGRAHPRAARHQRARDIAWQLAREWRDAELVVVGDAGHGAGHPSTWTRSSLRPPASPRPLSETPPASLRERRTARRTPVPLKPRPESPERS